MAAGIGARVEASSKYPQHVMIAGGVIEGLATALTLQQIGVPDTDLNGRSDRI